MTSRDFAYWLQGFFEITDAKEINTTQTDLIKRHLNLVFFHEIDPSYTSDKNKQQEMQAIHDGKKKPYHMTQTDASSVNWPPSEWEGPHSGHSGNMFPNEGDVILRC